MHTHPVLLEHFFCLFSTVRRIRCTHAFAIWIYHLFREPIKLLQHWAFKTSSWCRMSNTRVHCRIMFHKGHIVPHKNITAVRYECWMAQAHISTNMNHKTRAHTLAPSLKNVFRGFMKYLKYRVSCHFLHADRQFILYRDDWPLHSEWIFQFFFWFI